MQIFSFLTVVALGLIAIAIVSIVFKHSAKNQSPAADAEETILIQQLYKTLDRLEKRIEVLETLLMEHSSANSGANSKNIGRM